MKEIHKSCGGVMYDSITTLTWVPTDSLEKYKFNVKHFPKQMKNWNINSVTYTLNSYGFRNDFEFDSNLKKKKNLIVFGCSNTFGIGIPLQNTYGYLIAKELGLNLVNLAVPGGSMDSAARVASFWLQKVNPSLVILQVPDISRREFLTDTGLSIKGSWDKKWMKHFLYYADEHDNHYNKEKNTYLIKSLLPENVKFFSFAWSDPNFVIFKDHARDLTHSGIITNNYAAQKVLNELERNIY